VAIRFCSSLTYSPPHRDPDWRFELYQLDWIYLAHSPLRFSFGMYKSDFGLLPAPSLEITALILSLKQSTAWKEKPAYPGALYACFVIPLLPKISKQGNGIQIQSYPNRISGPLDEWSPTPNPRPKTCKTKTKRKISDLMVYNHQIFVNEPSGRASW